MRFVLGTLFVATLWTQGAPTSDVADFNGFMALSTVKIVGPSAKLPGKFTIGTGFLVGRPNVGDATSGAQVLVTAAHVLDEIAGDVATIVIRVARADGTYSRVEVAQPIREKGKPIFATHPKADIAALYSYLPQVTTVVSVNMLAEDDLWRKYEVSMGDEVFAAGYPLGAEGPAGFAILRSGRISSFPLLPTATVGRFLIDYNVHPGNSGGPVYLTDRARFLLGTKGVWSVRILLGLVSQQMTAGNQRLEVAVVEPAVFIKQTIAMLPQLEMK